MAGDATAARYHRIQFRLGLVSWALGVGYVVAVLLTGAAAALARAAGDWPWWTQVALLAAALAIAHRALSALLGLAGVEVVYALLRATPEWWWLFAWLAALALYLLLAVVLPVWIVPLFYRLTPLADDTLRARLLALATRVGAPAIGVWVADQSRKSRTANAAVVGLGTTRRILLFDTMLGFAPREVEAVLAHELGHHVHHDMWRGLAAQGVLTLVSFAVAAVALHAGVRWWGLRDVSDPAGLPWLAIVIGAVGLAAVPLANAYSRWIERRADDFALRVTGDPEGFIGAMERLAGLNLAGRRPHRLKEVLLYSHPAIDRRIARARAHR
jgi:STE24 endopeptidase